jgi:hypothetical protein
MVAIGRAGHAFNRTFILSSLSAPLRLNWSDLIDVTADGFQGPANWFLNSALLMRRMVHR